MARYGIYNSLAQLAIKIGAPGVPDFYQGTELWDFSLVDPDNRRPVDYERRVRAARRDAGRVARDGRADVAAELLDIPRRSLKLFATTTLLRARRQAYDLFRCGGIKPLTSRDRGATTCSRLRAPRPTTGDRRRSPARRHADARWRRAADR